MTAVPNGMEQLNAVRVHRWDSIRYKLALFVAALVVFTTLSLTLSAYVFVHQLLLNKVRDRLTLDATNRSEMLQAYIQQQHERAALVASRTKLRELLLHYQEGALAADPFRTQSGRILNDARQSTGEFVAIWIADPQGRVLTATHPEYLERDYAAHSAFVRGQ